MLSKTVQLFKIICRHYLRSSAVRCPHCLRHCHREETFGRREEGLSVFHFFTGLYIAVQFCAVPHQCPVLLHFSNYTGHHIRHSHSSYLLVFLLVVNGNKINFLFVFYFATIKILVGNPKSFLKWKGHENVLKSKLRYIVLNSSC